MDCERIGLSGGEFERGEGGLGSLGKKGTGLRKGDPGVDVARGEFFQKGSSDQHNPR